ncbi:sterol 24-C-methyltransferase/24-methylenesterol C-methyltransferase [Amycolatopsis xylanica]|uniref:Sterol 24-C-methyltransferase/24-methylenesterol C-methyltransferase n=1 Tax=Amycolatopsis xylanica TaxID=589385 RepID=A0A1H3CRJ1_9PSEU|nr:class I SAM-dependent methyltransferase [Amycolatopsis xylanica]SDX56852.1 sterol 24-C-methyltransferase/24-methylenesterol C-methyltransferase [Amycolatopsis xylanica]
MAQVDEHLDRLKELISSEDSRDGNFEEMVLTFYDLVSDKYRSDWGQSNHLAPIKDGQTIDEAMLELELALAKRGGFTAGQSLLELGSGIGGPAMNIAEHIGANVTGLDFSPKRVEGARQHAERRGLSDRVKFVQGDAQKIPFDDNSFDGAYTSEAICHVPDKTAVHREVARVLRPGGRWVGHDWLAADGLTAEQREELIEPVARTQSLHHMSTPSELKADLEAAGFTDIVVGNLPDEQDWTGQWDFLEAKSREVQGFDDPVFHFLGEGGFAVSRAAREGAFLVVYFEATLPS